MSLLGLLLAFGVGTLFGCLGTSRVAYLHRAAEERARGLK